MAKEAPTIAVVIDDSGTSPRTISNDITNLDWAIPRGVQDVTGVDKAAIERLLLLADFSITVNGVFNDVTNMSHDVLKTVASTSQARTVTLTTSGRSLENETLFTDYALTRASSGEFTWTAPGVLSDGAAPTWA